MLFKKKRYYLENGIKAEADSRLLVDPLIPANTLAYFCLDNLYHGKIITVWYDKSVKK